MGQALTDPCQVMDQFRDCIICFKVFIPELEFQHNPNPDIPTTVSRLCRILQVPHLTSLFTHICLRSSFCNTCQIKLVDATKLIDEWEALTAKVTEARGDLETDLVQAGKIGLTFRSNSGSGIARRRILDELRRAGAVSSIEIQSVGSLKASPILANSNSGIDISTSDTPRIDITTLSTPEVDNHDLDGISDAEEDFEPAILDSQEFNSPSRNLEVFERVVNDGEGSQRSSEGHHEPEESYPELKGVQNQLKPLQIVLEQLQIDETCVGFALNAPYIIDFMERDRQRVEKIAKSRNWRPKVVRTARKCTNPGFRCTFRGCRFRAKTRRGFTMHKIKARHMEPEVKTEQSEPESDQEEQFRPQQMTPPPKLYPETTFGDFRRIETSGYSGNSGNITFAKRKQIGKRVGRRTSYVWGFFDLIEDEVNPRGICKLCSEVFKCPGGSTTGMRGHIERKHAGELRNPSKLVPRIPNIVIVPSRISPKKPLSKIPEFPQKKRKTYRCSHCRGEYNCSSHLALHQKDFSARGPFTNGSFTCPHCKAKFPGKPCIRVHMEKDHPAVGSIPCASCPKTFDNAWELRRHRLKHLRSKPVSNTQKYSCKSCFTPLGSLQKLLEHGKVCKKVKKPQNSVFGANSSRNEVQNSTNSQEIAVKTPGGANRTPQTCTHCGKSYMRRILLTKHQRFFADAGPFVKASFPCEDCSQVLPGPSCLNAHIETHHPERAQYPCGNCSERFCKAVSLGIHVLKAHGRKMKRKSPVKKDFPCPQCSSVFYSEKSLANHMEMHDGPCPEKCSVCPAEFRYKISRKRHEIDIHGIEGDFKCRDCFKSFPTSKQLQVHEGYIDAGTMEECSICRASFQSKFCIMFHRKKHSIMNGDAQNAVKTPESPETRPKSPEITIPSFTCEYSGCGKAFHTELSLSRHKNRTGHRKGKKSGGFRCEFCPKLYTNDFSLQVHRNSHTKEIEFKCEKGCGKVFYSQQNLHQHTTKYCRGGDVKVETPNGQEEEVDEERYSCGICKNTWPDLDALQKHLTEHFKI